MPDYKRGRSTRHRAGRVPALDSTPQAVDRHRRAATCSGAIGGYCFRRCLGGGIRRIACRAMAIVPPQVGPADADPVRTTQPQTRQRAERLGSPVLRGTDFTELGMVNVTFRRVEYPAARKYAHNNRPDRQDSPRRIGDMARERAVERRPDRVSQRVPQPPSHELYQFVSAEPPVPGITDQNAPSVPRRYRLTSPFSHS